MSAAVLLAPAAATLGVMPFLGAFNHGFLALDDQVALVENANFGSLSASGLRWAWKTTMLGTYQPVSWTVFELERSLFGLNPRGFHAFGLALYWLSLVLLYGLFLAILKRARPDLEKRHPWSVRAAACAGLALFGSHPLRTEAVSWVSCQPFLLCFLFATASTWAYLKAFPVGGRVNRPALGACFALFILALLSKPAAILLPLAFLAIDFCVPGRPEKEPRAKRRRGVSVLIEKIPFFAASAVVGWIALTARFGDPTAAIVRPMDERLNSILFRMGYYLYKTIVPIELSPLYFSPAPDEWWRHEFAIPIMLSVAFAMIAIRAWKTRRGVTVAWILNLVLMIPATAPFVRSRFFLGDRYALLSTVAVWVVATSAFASLLVRLGPRGRAISLAGCVLVYAGFWRMSRDQSLTFRDNESMWKHASRFGCRRQRAIMTSNLASLAIGRDDIAAAMKLDESALAIDPDCPEAHIALGAAYEHLQKPDLAIEHYRAAVRVGPANPAARLALGEFLFKHARAEEAIEELRIAQSLAPDDARIPLLRRDAEHALAWIRTDPEKLAARDRANADVMLAIRLFGEGSIPAAIDRLKDAVKADPTNFDAWNNLGLMYIKQRDPRSAEPCFAKGVEIRPRDSVARMNWAGALLETGRIDPGVEQLRESTRLDPANLAAKKSLNQVIELLAARARKPRS